MKFLRRYFSGLSVLLAVGMVVGTAGCAGMFQTKQRVLVDAIAALDAPKPAGQSYRVIKKAGLLSQPASFTVIKACVDAGLARAGMYEAPSNVPSDIFVEINYGMDTTTRIDAAARESFLQLSARSNRKRTIDDFKGEEELWDVRVAITGLAGRLESVMPLLSTVGSKYVGTDTHVETVLQISDGSPEVSALRESVIRALSIQSQSPPPSSPPQTATAGAAPSATK